MTAPVTADTSVVIPAMAEWHPSHASSRRAVQPVRRLPAHVWLESISVLTRLPHGLAVSPDVAVSALLGRFRQPPWVLPAEGHVALTTRMAEMGIGRKRVYDALIGAVAADVGARLLTRDRRALPTYRSVGADAALVQ